MNSPVKPAVKSTEPTQIKTAALQASPILAADEINLKDPEYYLNRHISLMQFNLRVLEQALDDNYPLLERLNFLLIFSSNMDEFFEVRMAGLQRQISFARESIQNDGRPPAEVLKELAALCHHGFEKQYQIFNDSLKPLLMKERIRFLARSHWSPEIVEWASDYFHNQIMPVISPIGLDPAHPFPRLVNKGLNFIVSLEGNDAFGREINRAIVPAPRPLPRLIRVPDEFVKDGDNYVFLSSVLHAHVGELFPGMKATGCYQFRLTRDADLDLNAAEVEDIARALRGELYSRRFGSAVRLEVDALCPQDLVEFLLDQVNLTEDQLYKMHGPVNLGRVSTILNSLERPELRFPPIVPCLPKQLQKEETQILDVIAHEDILLHHPYQSFTPVVDMLRQASRDPSVLAIKQTLYRTGANSEIVNALIEAARNNKEVTAVIELRARFDEAENLQLASRLQEAGVVVTYGVVSYKTHAKLMLIVRREEDKLRRYVHFGTGNYHSVNSRLYTDYSVLSSDLELSSDIHKIFQQLTGMGKAEGLTKLLSAPFSLRKKLIRMIRCEAEIAQQATSENKLAAGKGDSAQQKNLPPRIIVKVNSVTDSRVIEELYKASQAGVKIDLIVRGMCCLRPGIAGISENIRVISVIGRFLEHSRVYYFANSEPSLYCSSADFMERNLKHRVEAAMPICNKKLKQRILSELELFVSKDCYRWELQSDGNYLPPDQSRRDAFFSVQDTFVEKLCGQEVRPGYVESFIT